MFSNENTSLPPDKVARMFNMILHNVVHTRHFLQGPGQINNISLN